MVGTRPGHDRRHDDGRVVAEVRRAVAGRRPVDAREAGAIPRLLRELDRLPHPLDQHADPTHLTGSAIVVGPRGTLLHRHRRLGLWLQPGGHLDPGETPADAAARELTEETGLAARHPGQPPAPYLVHVDVHAGGRGHIHLDLRYLLLAGDDDPAPPPGESQEVRWFDWDEAVAVADPGLIGALRALAPTPP